MNKGIPNCRSRMNISRVSVAGLGHVGLPTAVYMARKGLKVQGYDSSEEAVEYASRKGIRASTNPDRLDAEAIIICVNTFVKDAKPVIDPVVDVVRRISELRKGRKTFVSIESTMPPGGCRSLFSQFLGPSFLLVHVPHRFWAGDTRNHGVRQLRVIGALDGASLDAGTNFYGKRLHVPLHRVGSLEIAEVSKVLENAYRYVQIAFAEEAKMILADSGVDFEAARESSNTKWNIDIPEAREGIGGECLPKDVLICPP